MLTFIVGIDVSKKKFDSAYIISKKETKNLPECMNNQASIKHYLGNLTKLKEQNKCEKIRLIIEPSGGYEQNLAYMAIKEGFEVSMPNPYNVRRWLEGIGTRSKTDQMDARGLAMYGANVELPMWKPMPKEVEVLAGLLERKDEILEILQQEKNRLHALENKYIGNPRVERSIRDSISHFEKDLQEVTDNIDNLLNKHPSIKEKAKLIKGTPGVGDGTVLHYTVLCYRWQSLTSGTRDSKALAAYVGLDPVLYSSGSSVYKRPQISKRGNPNIRAKLYMSALGGKKGNNPLKPFYNQLLARNKNKKLALVACVRKVLVWVWAIFSTDTPFDSSRFSNV